MFALAARFSVYVVIAHVSAVMLVFYVHICMYVLACLRYLCITTLDQCILLISVAARVEALNRHELSLSSTSKDALVPPLPPAAAPLPPLVQPPQTPATTSSAFDRAALPQATAVAVNDNSSKLGGRGGDSSTWRFLKASFSQIDMDIWRTKVKLIF